MDKPETTCGKCGKVQQPGDVFVTEYACSLDCLRAMSQEEKQRAAAPWLRYYNSRGIPTRDPR